MAGAVMATTFNIDALQLGYGTRVQKTGHSVPAASTCNLRAHGGSFSSTQSIVKCPSKFVKEFDGMGKSTTVNDLSNQYVDSDRSTEDADGAGVEARSQEEGTDEQPSPRLNTPPGLEVPRSFRVPGTRVKNAKVCKDVDATSKRTDKLNEKSIGLDPITGSSDESSRGTPFQEESADEMSVNRGLLKPLPRLCAPPGLESPCRLKVPGSRLKNAKLHTDLDDMDATTVADDLSEEHMDSHPSSRSSNGSDIETHVRDEAIDELSWNKGLYGPPPGLSAPPGLEAPRTLKAQGTRLNSQARAFVPSFATSVPHEALQQNSVGVSHVFSLQKAVHGLTPQEKNIVRYFLESKAQEQKPQHVPGVFAAHGKLPQRPPGVFAPQCPPGIFAAGVPSVQEPNDTTDSLRSNLYDLSLLDSRTVLMVRNIQRIGMDSAAALEAYFSKFGKIERVMVSHWRSKKKGQVRLCPATMGFLVMSNTEDVQAVLAFGEEHCVNDVAVSALPFQSHPVDSI